VLRCLKLNGPFLIFPLFCLLIGEREPEWGGGRLLVFLHASIGGLGAKRREAGDNSFAGELFFLWEGVVMKSRGSVRANFQFPRL